MRTIKNSVGVWFDEIKRKFLKTAQEIEVEKRKYISEEQEK